MLLGIIQYKLLSIQVYTDANMQKKIDLDKKTVGNWPGGEIFLIHSDIHQWFYKILYLCILKKHHQE